MIAAFPQLGERVDATSAAVAIITELTSSKLFGQRTLSQNMETAPVTGPFYV
jgi:hypothetical protein